MTYFNPKNSLSQSVKRLTALALLTTLGACSSTPSHVLSSPAPIVNTAPAEVIDQDCLLQASQMAHSAETSGATAQYVTAARYMQSCMQQPLPAPLDKNQSQAVMQLMANITLNFIQGGDIAAAQQQLRHFDRKFANQDLYLPDFTSFRDTASALLQGTSMSKHQLANLNISRELRNELERQQYWLSH
ncbi:hypothetical protein [Paraglaciecola hydrolytica]|uniref:Uncharacterized protein n=1 Tax=Paraglaciecola hydrolytica TaxID=1799789 RepID=A0A135ZZ12_9ALTE|nr:hypothetical protein [Paraglaciecola hydrolytica]KXI28226.1 hypothetical protein AX660_17765 [Paraglaciecola hydrolytica]